MDLISTLIKRPISLVLNTTNPGSPSSSSDNQQQQQQRQKSPSPVVTPQSSSLFASAMNTSLMEPPLSSPSQQQPLNEPPCPSTTAMAATTPQSPCSNSSSSVTTSNTIEELLIQINDNLNQASLSDEVSELSPLATKPVVGAGISSSNSSKLTPTSRAHATAAASLSPSSSTAASDAAILEVNSSLNQFHIGHELDDVLFDEGHLHFNKDTGVNLSSQKFIGLTEFDESSIPELPGSLNPDIEEQLKFTFEEGLIPTLTANVNTGGLNSTIKKADDEINNKIQLLAASAASAASNETDTAVSSDNETFAECQSYDPDVVNITSDLVNTPNAAELSELETYRSALNTTETTTHDGDDQLNATMENVPEIADADVLDECIFSFVAEGNNLSKLEDPLFQQQAANKSFADEPMDVDMDMNLTQDLEYASNLTAEADCLYGNQNVSSDIQHVADGLELENNDINPFRALKNISTDLQHVPGGSQHAAGGLESVAIAMENIASGSQDVESGVQHLNENKNVPNRVKHVSSRLSDIDYVLQKAANGLNEFVDVSSGSLNVGSSFQYSPNISRHLNEPQNVSSASQDVASSSRDVDIGLYHGKEFQHGSSGSQDVASGPQDVASGSQDVACGSQDVAGGSQDVASGSQDIPSGSEDVTSAENAHPGALSLSINKDRRTFSISPTRHDSNDAEAVIPKSHHEHLLNKSVELPISRSRTYNSDICVIQDNSIDSATDGWPSSNEVDDIFLDNFGANCAPISPRTLENDLVEQISSTAVVAEEVTPKVDALPKAMTATFTKSKLPSSNAAVVMDAKLSLPLEINASFSSAKSSASTSPTFPIKEPKSLHYFPHSPTAKPEKKKATFLEKSENAERINAAEKIRKTSVTQKLQQQQQAAATVKITLASPEEAIKKIDAPNVNESVRIPASKRERSVSPGPLKTSVVAVLNGTFDQSALSTTPATTEEKRLTFNVASTTPSPTPDTEFELPLKTSTTTIASDDERRRTFNLSESTLSATAQLDISCEPMDVDDVAATSPYPKSPPIPTLQKRQNEEKLVADLQKLSSSPPVPSLQKRPLEVFELPPQANSPPIPTLQRPHVEKELQSHSPPLPTLQKRPPIHPPPPRPSSSSFDPFASPANAEMLSAKEKTKSNARDEKDVVHVDKFAAPSPSEERFVSPSQLFASFGSGATANAYTRNSMQQQRQLFSDADFQSNSDLVLNPCDFDYLLTKGNNNVHVDRSSLLLRFDPLLGVPVPVNQPQQQQQQLLQVLTNVSGSNNFSGLSPTIEEDEQSNRSFVVEEETTPDSVDADSAKLKERSADVEVEEQFVKEKQQQNLQQLQQVAKAKKNVRMSVEVIKDMNIDNDCKKSFENSNSQSDEKQSNFKMDELEKKIKNEVLKTEDIEKKLKEAEQREEALIKRITEKDKTISKMNGVIEAYEKAIAELISEKEQLIQNYEQQLAEAKADRDSNYQHLTSLETTFSDLHVKYEKSKEMTSQLKSSEESLLAEKRQNLENLRLQEQRYEKMKNHAMQQLEIANRKLESLTKEHAIESTKLKALLKKEEISRASINEQLLQKSRENAELVKICDELINGQGS